jgi:hypothetical protein
MGIVTMAKPKGKPKEQPSSKSTNPIALTIRGSIEWRAWVDRGAEHCRTDVAKAVDAALIEYFKGRGFTEAPPKR